MREDEIIIQRVSPLFGLIILFLSLQRTGIEQIVSPVLYSIQYFINVAGKPFPWPLFLAARHGAYTRKLGCLPPSPLIITSMVARLP